MLPATLDKQETPSKAQKRDPDRSSFEAIGKRGPTEKDQD